jgi:small conductance mechanosensitive channel
MPDGLSSILDPSTIATLLRIVVIVGLAVIANSLVRMLTHQVEGRLIASTINREHQARIRTFIQLARSVTYVVVLIIAALMILTALHIDIGPLLAGAGLAGLAITLGAQSLIKDFIGGASILIENPFGVGDVIAVGDVSGEVERITLRATYLRDIEGKLHIVPNGEIRVMSNLTTRWARAVVDLNVAYESNMDAVLRALQTAADRAQADENIKPHLLEAPQAMSWIGFKDWAVQVRVMAKTLPGKQWGVAMVLRQYAVEALQSEGVRVAIPAQEVRFDPVPSGHRTDRAAEERGKNRAEPNHFDSARSG